MSDDEIFVIIVSSIAAFWGTVAHTSFKLPTAYRRDNPGLGLVRLAVLAALGWIAYVLAYHADPSVEGIYNVFYMVMGYAVIVLFGISGARLFGIKARVDVGERRNWAAGIFLASFTLGTGLIFGASLWGNADPTGGNDEGGWWIPLGFFLMGWVIMTVGLAFYCWREKGSFRRSIRQERDAGMAIGTASFTINASLLMISAVSGDFWGWGAGIKDVALAGIMLGVHEFIRLPDHTMGNRPFLRTVEFMSYFGIVGANMLYLWLKS